MTVAIIPVKGRLPLLPHTIEQALKVVDEVICITSKAYEKEYCIGAEATNMGQGFKLGEKWNVGFEAARKYDPDHVLFIGSSDWVSENWVDVMLPYSEDYEVVGVQGFNLLHLDYEIPIRNAAGEIEMNEKFRRRIKEKRRCKAGVHAVEVKFKGARVGLWSGYEGRRKGEPVGIGRVLNRDFLKRIDYKPFADNQKSNMDYHMFNLAKSYKTINSKAIKCLSISTNLWGNHHSFEDSDEIQDNGFIDKWFPDAHKLMEWEEIKLINLEHGMR